MTVLENVEIVLKAKEVPVMRSNSLQIRLIHMVELTGYEEAYPRECREE